MAAQERGRALEMFGVFRVAPVVRVAVSGSSLASVYPNPFLSLLSSHPGFLQWDKWHKKKKGLTCSYWSQLQFVHLNDLFVMFILFRGSRFKELIEYFSLSQRCLKLLPLNNLLWRRAVLRNH